MHIRLPNRKISVIIPTFNALKTLPQAIESVLNQSYESKEIIVVDGGSIDGTVDYLNTLQAPSLRWISETDKGIYDAMNKGVRIASGEWHYFLGADDTLALDIFSTIAPELNDSFRIVFGDVQFENGYRMVSFLKSRTWLQNTLHHQSAFYHRSLFTDFQYDTSLRVMSDYELNLLIHVKNLPTRYVPVVVALCHTGGASSQLSVGLKETNLIRGRFIGSDWQNKVLSFILELYYAQKQLRKWLYGHKI